MRETAPPKPKIDEPTPKPYHPTMRRNLPYVAFLLMCFAVVGLTGLFASYGPLIPLERAQARNDVLDQALAAARAPDGPAKLEAMRDALGSTADTVLAPGDLTDRIQSARALIRSEATRETNSVAYRVRLMLFMVTLLSGLFGTGVMLFALKQQRT